MNRTFAPNAKATLALGYKVQRSWTESPAIFDGYKISKSDLDATIVKAETAHSAVAAAREQRTTELARLKAALKEKQTKAKDEYTLAVTALNDTLNSATTAEKQACTELSQSANGARYYAKSEMLSNSSTADDATGRAI